MRDISIRLRSLPSVQFAHEFSSDEYGFFFPRLENYLEIAYIAEGDIEVHRRDGVEIVPQGSLRIWWRQEDERTLCRTHHAHVTVGLDVQYERGDELTLPECLPNADEKFRRDITAIVREYDLRGADTIELKARVFRLLADVAAEYERRNARSDAFGLELYRKKAERYIVAHLKEKIRIADIADALQLSEGYFSEIFHRATGQTPIEYVNRKKLLKVKELTAAMHCPIRVAAEQMGFDDPNYVSRLYRKYFGISLRDDLRN